MELFNKLFATRQFQPHAYCLNWKAEPGIYWTTLLSNLLIGLAYVAISGTLVYMVHKGRRAIPFHRMFLAFGLFIIACGCTHFMDVVTLQHPMYALSALVLAVTAAASVATAFALPGLVPLAINLVSSARVSEQRRLDLEKAHTDLEGLYNRTLELEKLKTQFFANVSHDLRTPLTLILGPTAKLLADPSLSSAHHQALEVVNRNARALLTQVNDLLDLSKIDAGKMQPDYSRVDLSRLLRITAAHFESLAMERQITFTLDAPAEAAADVDGEKIQRILVNLLSNAFKFVPDSGEIHCSLSTHEGRASIEVKDSGPGIPESMRDVVFERFSQGESSAGGTGLGLAISRDFAELHGGNISVQEAAGGGALFRVEIPTQAPPGAQVARVTPAAGNTRLPTEWQPVKDAGTGRPEDNTIQDPSARQPGNTEAPLVLIVEDNPEMSRFVAETLAEYRVAAAFNGMDGLEQAVQLHPDLIVSDVMLPGCTGEEMVRKIRSEHVELDDAAILMLTAKADDELRINLLHSGAQDYMMKPFSPDELRVRARNLISMKRAREVLQHASQSSLQDVEALANEVALRRTETEEALEAMRTARNHAEKVSQVKSNFLALVSHELRTPLTIITAYIYLLEQDEAALSPTQQKCVAKVRASSTRLGGLIDSLLEYTHIQTERIITHPTSFDVSSLAAGVIEEAQLQAPGRTIQLDETSDCPPLYSDERLVRLVMLNLLGNAIKYSRQGPVVMTLAYSEAGHEIAVSDRGAGIPTDLQPGIFEPFHQADDVSHKHTSGFGLGLAIVKEIVGALGGSIRVQSVEGEGSTFTVALKALPEPASQVPASQEPAPQ